MIYLDADEFPTEQSCYFSFNNKRWYWVDNTDHLIHTDFYLDNKFGISPTVLVEWNEE